MENWRMLWPYGLAFWSCVDKMPSRRLWLTCCRRREWHSNMIGSCVALHPCRPILRMSVFSPHGLEPGAATCPNHTQRCARVAPCSNGNSKHCWDNRQLTKASELTSLGDVTLCDCRKEPKKPAGSQSRAVTTKAPRPSQL